MPFHLENSIRPLLCPPHEACLDRGSRGMRGKAVFRILNRPDPKSQHQARLWPRIRGLLYLVRPLRDHHPPNRAHYRRCLYRNHQPLLVAAVRKLFDWLVAGQILPMNPMTTVCGPKQVVRRGKTPVLKAENT